MSKFVITTRKNGEFQFNLVANNGQVILTSEGYTTKKACQAGIDSVRKNSKENRFETKIAINGKHHFNLKASNGQIVGTSQLYKSVTGCKKGMQSVINNAAIAQIVDKTE